MEQRAYSFDLNVQPKSIIKVVGVGGGGSNAVNYMYNQGFRDVEFVVCNTDAQALKTSPVPSKIQLGGSLLNGLGAGSIPENGKEAAILSEDAIREMFSDGTKMVFITAGMGGGTGTGAAPVIARIAKEMQILTIGIVTKPFRFEGPRKNASADKGIAEMRQYCDTVIEILNDKIRELFGNMSMNQAFAQADHILSTSAKSLSEIITVPGIINVDFKDIETTMKESGTAVMGSAMAKGDNRALKAVMDAISSPLLNNNDIAGATKILLAINSGHAPELTMDEFDQITEFISQRAGHGADFIFGTSMDPELGDTIQVTVVATGFNHEAMAAAQEPKVVDLVQRPGVDEHFGQTTSAPLPTQDPQPAPMYQPAPKPVAAPPVQTPRMPNPYETAAQYAAPTPSPEVPTSRPVTPVPPTPTPEPVQYLDIDGNFKLMYESPDGVDRPLDRVQEIMSGQKDFGRTISKAEVLRNLSAGAIQRPNYDDPDFLRQNEQPAYLRKQSPLASGPVSHENTSRYTLNENGEMLDNNRFFNPRVD